MTGYDILKQAKALLGYLNYGSATHTPDEVNNLGVEAVKNILADLKCGEVTSLNTELNISSEKGNAAIYGVAMMVALIVGDNNKNCPFTEIYNSKRAAALSEITEISDRLPITEG